MIELEPVGVGPLRELSVEIPCSRVNAGDVSGRQASATARSGKRQSRKQAYFLHGSSSIGRAAVSKTAGWGFKSSLPCLVLGAEAGFSFGVAGTGFVGGVGLDSSEATGIFVGGGVDGPVLAGFVFCCGVGISVIFIL